MVFRLKENKKDQNGAGRTAIQKITGLMERGEIDDSQIELKLLPNWDQVYEVTIFLTILRSIQPDCRTHAEAVLRTWSQFRTDFKKESEKMLKVFTEYEIFLLGLCESKSKETEDEVHAKQAGQLLEALKPLLEPAEFEKKYGGHNMVNPIAPDKPTKPN